MFPIGGSSAELGGGVPVLVREGCKKLTEIFFFLLIKLLFKEESVSNSRGFLAD